MSTFSGWIRCRKRTNIFINLSVGKLWHFSVRNRTAISIPLLEQRNGNISDISVTNMWYFSSGNISGNICPFSKSGSVWKSSYISALSRIKTRTTISTNISQPLFLVEPFVEIADMSWRLFGALKIIQSLQWLVVVAVGGWISAFMHPHCHHISPSAKSFGFARSSDHYLWDPTTSDCILRTCSNNHMV